MNPLYKMAGLTTLAIFLVLLLFIQYVDPATIPNGFTRNYLAPPLSPTIKKIKSKELTAISGTSASSIFFSTPDPNVIVVTDHHLNNRPDINLNLQEELIRKINGSFFTRVSNSFIFVFAYNLPGIIKLSKQLNSPELFILPHGFISRAVTVFDNKIILRKFDPFTKDQIFFSYLPGSQVLRPEKNISIIHNDGGMSTDGFLNFDQSTGTLVYTYLYSGRYIVFDTSLITSKKICRTIDTSYAFKFKSTSDGKVFTNNGPARMINKSSCISNDFLFINSNLRADNENSSTFSKNNVIDIYKLPSGKYAGSISLPSIDKEKLIAFTICESLVVALYKRHIATYDINSILSGIKN